jgi:hypothetical protein
VAGEKRPDSRGLSFFDITDFSPGIYDNSLIAFGSAPNTVPGIFPAPPGAADATATFGCMSLPNGGLGPGPALGGLPGTGGLSLDDMGLTGFTNVDITALTNSFQSHIDELIVGVTYNIDLTTGFQTTSFFSYDVAANVRNAIAGTTFTYNYSTNNKNFCAFPFTTTMDTSGIQPVVILPLTAPDGPNSNLFVYPSLADPTVFGVDVITDRQVGTAFGHQGRVVAIQINNGYGWPITPDRYPNELFNYTDPPESETWPGQAEVFGPENPFGYGAFNSVSAGELFAVKCRGGAVIIQGDLNNPTVTSLPGVKSTGVIYGRTDTDQNGLYYCCEEQGAWVWNGGNSSQKISTQLDDNFFKVANPITDTTYYGYYCQRWADWMLFSNNWIFNSTTGAWWRLSNPATESYFWYVPGWDPRFMFCAVQNVASSATPFLFEYDRTIPNGSYTWQSLPIKVPAEDRTSTMRELVIRASNPYADAAPQIIATLIDDKGNTSVLDTWTMTPGIDTVQETRLNAALKQTTTVAVNLACSGTLYAPVVHGLSMGSRTREHTGIT